MKKEKKPEQEGQKDQKKEKEDPKDLKIKELTDTLQRLQAEFENYKKRCEKEAGDFREYSDAKILEEILPVIDSLELALQNKDSGEFKKGVELIFAQLFSLLEAKGLRRFDSRGKKFDPYRHEVLITEESDKEEDVVLEELQKGYMLKDKILRYAKVKVSKKGTGEGK